VVSGPTCNENENDASVGFDCHNGYKSKKRSGKCNADEHLCRFDEITQAYNAGWRDWSWRRFAEPTAMIATLPVKCFTVNTLEYNSNSWGSVRLYFADTVTGAVHASVTHAGGSPMTQSVCLPATGYNVFLCGGSYSTDSSYRKFTSFTDLDLSGNIQYRVNMYGGAVGSWSADWATAGFSVWSQYAGDVGNIDSTGDSALNSVLRTVRWSWYPNPVDITMAVNYNYYYKLTLLMSENCCSRGYDIYINDQLVQASFAPYQIAGTRSSAFARFTYKYVSTSSTLKVRLIGSGNYPDNNPQINGVVLERYGPAEMQWYISGVNSWTNGGEVDCSNVSPVYMDLNNDLVGSRCPNASFPCPATSSLIETPLASPSRFDNNPNQLGALCCKNDCSGAKYCDGFNCFACPSCPAGQFRQGCMGTAQGSCVSCSSQNCKSGQTFVSSKCIGSNNGCVDSSCAATGCPN